MAAPLAGRSLIRFPGALFVATLPFGSLLADAPRAKNTKTRA
jgi:hypothetical protein